MSDQEPDVVYYRERHHRRGCGGCKRLTFGVVLFAVGLWFLLRNLGVEVPGLGDLWPVFPLLVFLSFIVSYVRGDRRGGVLATGVGGTLVSAFVLLYTLDLFPPEVTMEDLWPVFFFLVGAAFLSRWLAEPARKGPLAPAVLCTLLGFVGLLFTLHIVQDYWLRRGWPVILILVGLALVARGFLEARRR